MELMEAARHYNLCIMGRRGGGEEEWGGAGAGLGQKRSNKLCTQIHGLELYSTKIVSHCEKSITGYTKLIFCY